MNILTMDNIPFNMNKLPDFVDDLRFCVLDNSNPKEPDFFYVPLVFIETFSDPALLLKIGKHTIMMPYNWQIAIGDPEYGDIEIIPLTRINDRNFNAFVSNPWKSMTSKFENIEILDVYKEVKWYFPKMKPANLLAVPLTSEKESPCVYFIKDITKQCEVINISQVWS